MKDNTSSPALSFTIIVHLDPLLVHHAAPAEHHFAGDSDGVLSGRRRIRKVGLQLRMQAEWELLTYGLRL